MNTHERARSEYDAAIKEEREACAKIVDDQAAAYEEYAARADTSMNRTLNKLGAWTCRDLAFKIRNRG